MPDRSPSPRPLTVLRSRGLKGRFRTPGDPAVTVVALLLAAIARGETVIYADTHAPGRDVAATLRIIGAVGAGVEHHEDRWIISGLGTLGLLEPRGPLDLSGAGRALPLVMGLLAPYGFASQIEAGDGEVVLAPRGVGEALRAFGVEIRERRTGQLPLTLRGPRMGVPLLWRVPADASAECITAVLLVALGMPGVSVLTGLAALPRQVIGLMRHFGAEIIERLGSDGRTLDIRGLAALGSRTLAVPGNPDLAGFAIVAALTVPESDLLVEGVPVDKASTGVVDTLIEMGGSIETVHRRQVAGAEVVDFRVRYSPLLGTDVEPRGLTLAALPPLAVAGALAVGKMHIPRFGLAGETALHRAMADMLTANGATARVEATGLVVARAAPGSRLGGGTLPGATDPLVAAAQLVLGLAAAEAVTLADSGRLEAAFPGLIGGFEGLAAAFFRRRPA